MEALENEVKVEIDADQFETAVLSESYNRPVLLYYWAESCPPCVAISPLMDELAEEYDGAFLLAKIELDENMKLAGQLKISGVPTIIKYENGEETDRFVGALPRSQVSEFINSSL